MKRISQFAALALVALPLYAGAQTANTPGGSASTGSSLDQTNGAAQKAAPATTSTATSMTNPKGSLPKADESTEPGSATTEASRNMKSTSRKNLGKTSKPGDVPSYPAPAKDGTPTQ